MNEPQFPPARATFCGELPAGFRGLIGLYPQDLFRPEWIDTEVIDGVSLFVNGQRIQCDGSRYELRGATVCIGDALAIDVDNARTIPVYFKATIGGRSSCTRGEVAHGLQLGAKIERPALDRWCQHQPLPTS